jgi:hypothetical protein
MMPRRSGADRGQSRSVAVGRRQELDRLQRHEGRADEAADPERPERPGEVRETLGERAVGGRDEDVVLVGDRHRDREGDRQGEERDRGDEQAEDGAAGDQGDRDRRAGAGARGGRGGRGEGCGGGHGPMAPNGLGGSRVRASRVPAQHRAAARSGAIVIRPIGLRRMSRARCDAA